MATLNNYIGGQLTLERMLDLEDETPEGIPSRIHCVGNKLWILSQGRVFTLPLDGSRRITEQLDIHKQYRSENGETCRSRKDYKISALTQNKWGIFVLCSVSNNESASSSEGNSGPETTEPLKCIYQIRENGEIVPPRLSKGEYLDMGSNDDCVYVHKQAPRLRALPLLCVLRRETTANNELRWTKQELEIPRGTNGVLASQSHVIVVNEWGHNIFKFTHNNLNNQLFIATHGRQGSGAAGSLNLPSLCLCDSEGSVLIADKRNNRFQILTSANDWTVLNFHEVSMEMNPRHAAMDTLGNLYILLSRWTIAKVIRCNNVATGSCP